MISPFKVRAMCLRENLSETVSDQVVPTTASGLHGYQIFAKKKRRNGLLQQRLKRSKKGKRRESLNTAVNGERKKGVEVHYLN